MKTHHTSNSLWLFLALGILMTIAAAILKTYQQHSTPSTSTLPILNLISPFTLINQNGQPVDHTIFQNKVSLVSFTFTRCPGPCPAVLQRMSQFQTPFKRAFPHLQLITLTVDPEYDTPEILHNHAQTLHADTTLWTFLTGEKNHARRLVEKDFLLPVSDNPPEAQQEHGAVLHSTRLALVDTQGRIRQYYDAFDPELFPKVLHDVGTLLRDAGLSLPQK